MEPIAIKLLGFAAATCTTLAYAPQFVKVWRTRSTEDISLGMFLVMVLGLLLWDRFAVVTRATTQQVRALDYVAAAQATGWPEYV